MASAVALTCISMTASSFTSPSVTVIVFAELVMEASVFLLISLIADAISRSKLEGKAKTISAAAARKSPERAVYEDMSKADNVTP